LILGSLNYFLISQILLVVGVLDLRTGFFKEDAASKSGLLLESKSTDFFTRNA